MKKYVEWLLLPVAIIASIVFLLFAKSWGMHTYDYGIFQKFFFGTALFFGVVLVARLTFKLTFPLLYEYISRDFNKKIQWNALNDTQKIFVGLLLLSVYILALAMLVANL